MLQQRSERFLLREWADGCVIFDRRFGNTHALNSITAAVFKALLAAPDEDPQDVLARLNAERHEPESPDLQSIHEAFELLAVHQLTARD